jgi:hypothetical protein
MQNWKRRKRRRLFSRQWTLEKGKADLEKEKADLEAALAFVALIPKAPDAGLARAGVRAGSCSCARCRAGHSGGYHFGG